MPGGIITIIILYALAMLVPMLPAIIIFKLFPNDRIKIKGQLTSFTINATGGFAAYFATVLLGIFMINQVPSILEKLEQQPVSSTCTVKAKIIFMDQDNKPIDFIPANKLDNIHVGYIPSNIITTNNEIRVVMPELANNTKLMIELDGFRSYSTILDNSKIDKQTGCLDMGEIILRTEPRYEIKDSAKPSDVKMPI